MLNDSMVKLARERSLALAEETQVDGVVVLIWHSGDQLAVGYSIADTRGSADSEVAAMLLDALSVLPPNTEHTPQAAPAKDSENDN